MLWNDRSRHQHSHVSWKYNPVYLFASCWEAGDQCSLPKVMSAPRSSQPACVRCRERRLFWAAERSKSSAILTTIWKNNHNEPQFNVYTENLSNSGIKYTNSKLNEHIQTHTLPLEWGIPSGHWCTAPSRAAMAKLYPLTASGELFRALMRSAQRSSSGVSWLGSATATQRRHQAAARRAAMLGWRSTDITVSNRPAAQITNCNTGFHLSTMVTSSSVLFLLYDVDLLSFRRSISSLFSFFHYVLYVTTSCALSSALGDWSDWSRDSSE